MNKHEFDENVSSSSQNYEVKRSRKANIFAFILCVIIAFAIWIFAWNSDKAPEEQQTPAPQASIEDVNTPSTVSA